MGSRGAFDSNYGSAGGIPPSARQFFVMGVLGDVKVLVSNTAPNGPTITYSNSENTIYFSYSAKKQRIDKIFYYRNHKLVKSVDLYDKLGPHVHYWHSGVVGRKSHDKKNIYPLSDQDEKLAQLAYKYNEGKI